jgi:hypothetical protein
MTGEHRIVSDQPQNLHAELWSALATNAVLLGASPEARSRLLRERAGLWDRLAAVSSPACGQAYRTAAAECLAESSGAAPAQRDPQRRAALA